jgi:hypothetical protein
MSDSFKPAGLIVASIVAGLAAPGAGAVQAADAAMAERDAQADALAKAAELFKAAEPFAEAVDDGPDQRAFDL